MSSEIEFQDIVTFKNPSAFKSKKWGDSAIWGVICKYPKDLQEKFKILLDVTHEYLKNGFSTDFFIKYRFTRRFMKSFTYNLAETESLEKSFVVAGGIKEEIGLNWCCFKIRNYYRQNLRPPSSAIPFFRPFYYYCKSGAFKKNGIKTWKELLHKTLKGYQLIELERETIQNTAGLQRASKHLLKISHQIGRIPQGVDPGIQLIRRAADRGSWNQFGIKSWIELLNHVFGSDKVPLCKWKGLEGLKRAQKILEDISIQKFPKIPTTSDISSSVPAVLKKNYWAEFGINNWDDLIKSVCRDYSPPRKIQQGERGYLEAQKQLKEFYLKNQRLPVSKDFRNIAVKCFQKYWIEFEISSWNDLLFKVFGKVKNISKKWRGKNGYLEAQKQLKEFYLKNQRLPVSRDFHNITVKCSQKYWIEFEISSWNDLLFKVFGKVNVTPNIWQGQKGLHFAQNVLEKNYKEHKCWLNPSIKPFNKIYCAILRKTWIHFGIKSWKDLIHSVSEN